MATAAVLFPPSNHILPGSRFLSTAPFPDIKGDQSTSPEPSSSLEDIVSGWVSSFNRLLSDVERSSSRFFAKESCWRDLLCMSWDFRTIQGPEQITAFIEKSSKDDRIVSISLDKKYAAHKAPQLATFGELSVIQAGLLVETPTGRGEGFVRLVLDPADSGVWKAFTLFTTLKELKGYEETICNRRPTGLRDSSDDGRPNWKDRLVAQQNFDGGREPTVLILGWSFPKKLLKSHWADIFFSGGAGQGGLTAAARLKQLGIETLIIDQNPRVGDNWRNRYHQLVLHDSVWYDIRQIS